MTLRNRAFWIAAAFCLILDQLTKLWAAQGLAFAQTVPIFNGIIGLFLTTNPGAAWSICSQQGCRELLPWLSIGVSGVLMLVGFYAKRLNFWEQIGYGCILSGALGNGVDRIVHGEVVDFFKFLFMEFPVFNVADICINVGIICLIIAAFTTPAPSNSNPRRS